MKTALADICKEVENLSYIEEDKKFDIVFFLGSGWKFMALVTG